MIDIYTKTVDEDSWVIDKTHDPNEWLFNQSLLANAIGYETYIDAGCLFVLDNGKLDRIYLTHDGKEITYDVLREIENY